ncbi:phosphate transport regulator [Boudabousia liubingyangii]|uniref:DUF47 domain-containing protein n=1 Tax=Boudabousia liubingyangii TaxID=1921764 RepID=UPI000939CFEF|nr:DUF47 family protein [Boudabousia liubingyangii]OKL48409.1 phosphate transport regulator [Boudabousia liubingyangii]
MGISFRSSDSAFFDLFTTTADHLVKGIAILDEIVHQDILERASLRDQLHEIEQAADLTTHQVIKTLNATFVTPIDREDIAELAHVLDDCMDYVDEAGDLIVLYQLEELPAGIFEQVKLLDQCAQLTATAMPGLRKMEGLRDYWIEINRLENAGDRVYRDMLATIFASGTDALTVIKLKDVIETLEKAMDRFEALANTVEAIAIKES